MNRKELAHRLVLQKAVLDLLAAADKDTRAEAKERYTGGDADQVGELGRVRMDKGRDTFTITDPDALLAWVKEHHPDAIVTREEIVPAFRTELLRKGTSMIVDDNGEITDVTPDGIERKPGSPRLVVTATDDAAIAARSILTPVLEVES